MAHAAGASILLPARRVFAGMRSVHVRHACGVHGLLLDLPHIYIVLP